MWIFGYGSLVWKVDFPYEEKVVGYIKGYLRRFWQASVDHRGIPEKPGRVVTLVKSENEEDRVWGVAYRIHSDREDEVISHLDYREKGGYTREIVSFYPQSHRLLPWPLTIYLGTENNPFYTGPVEDDAIAEVISRAEGPSGKNKDYLFNLVEAMKALGIYDEHLFSLYSKVALLTDL